MYNKTLQTNNSVLLFLPIEIKIEVGNGFEFESMTIKTPTEVDKLKWKFGFDSSIKSDQLDTFIFIEFY